MTNLTGKRVAFLATDGYEDSELVSPWEAISAAGADVVLVSPREGSIEGENGHTQVVDVAAADADVEHFDALVLPGGLPNGDALRLDEDAVRLTKAFFAQDKTVAAICHAAWILAEADAVQGRTLTSYASLRTDLRNAGADWIDAEVVVDGGLVTSRTPADLAAFNAKVIEEIATRDVTVGAN